MSVAPQPAPVRDSPDEVIAQTQEAGRLFLERVRAISGIGPVVTLGEGRLSVNVTDRRGEAAQQVYALEEELRRQHPQARLDVWVTEMPDPA
jgi:hypothetical protein